MAHPSANIRLLRARRHDIPWIQNLLCDVPPRRSALRAGGFPVHSPLAAGERLETEIGAVIEAPEFQPAHWGILVVDLAGGQTVYELNADRLFAPASVTKLFSTAAALDALGADYRFETPVYRRGEVDAGRAN